MSKIKHWLKVLILLLFFSSCENKGGDAEIVILCTNDIHGNLDCFPELAAYYSQLKKENPNTFLFNNGDMFSGNPLVDQYPEKGYPMIDIMNKTGYTLSSLGNHEFDYGQETLNSRIEQAEFPFICANIGFGKDAALKPLEPYKIIDAGGVSVAVLSLVEVGSGGTPSTHPDKVKGLSFEKPANTVDKYYSKLCRNNVFILLSHIGVENDVKIAEKYPGIDVILGGHSHTRIDTSMVKNGVLITQAGDNLKYAGETRITVKDGKVVKKSNKLVNLSKVGSRDKTVEKLLESYKEKDPGSKVIGQASANIRGKQKLGALMTDAVTEMLGLDIAVQNAGGIRINNLPKGDITINTVFSLDPFENDVVKINMSCDEVEGLLKSQFGRYNLPDLIVSGINYTIILDDKKKPVSVKISDYAGNPLDKTKKYAVGMNSYIYTKYKFPHKDEGQSLNVTSSETLINFIEKKGTINYGDIPDRIIIK